MNLPKVEPLRKEKDTIPNDVLLDFLQNELCLKDVKNITKVRDSYLWTIGDVERHRVDLFEKHEVEGEGEFCCTNRIGERSYFLHYHKAEKTITDKTTGRAEPDKKDPLKLKGIASGSERIGKSFR